LRVDVLTVLARFRAFFLRLLRRLRWVLAAFLVLIAWARWGPMEPLFNKPLSTVLLDRNGELLAASVANDGQWRMPPGDTIPARFERCLIEFEDRRFRNHWGVRLPSLIRAWRQNRKAGRTVSGGSTLTMQVARMARGDRTRSYGQKLIEMLIAFRIEVRCSKDEILGLYAANAPFGGNVVGLEAAAWRWYGRAPNDLGWGECATLAVLPNAPAQLHPGRNRDALRAKRDRLLDRLLIVHAIDSMEWSLAKDEPLPDAPVTLPQRAPHLLATLQNSGHEGERISSTVDGALQQRVTGLLDRYAPVLRANEIHNGAVLVLDVHTGEVLAYVGNIHSAGSEHAGAVDIVQARRSTGSLLKPFLYADMLQSGELMPDQLVADLPTSYDGFAPRNFDDRYDGAVPASQALARSLNVPAVRALRTHGVDRTLRMLRGMGLHHIDRSAEDYGLSLIVGGAESTLWEVTGAYASMARTLVRYRGEGTSDASAVHPPLLQHHGVHTATNDGPPPLSAASLYHTLLALQQLNRPEVETGWQQFAGGERIAWKTGTSFGHRDAWAVGVTDRYAVGVWTGNATGEGRPGLTGTLAAAPVLFEVFGLLQDGHGLEPPYDALDRMVVCRASGHRAAVDCDVVDTVWTIRAAERTLPCPYHHRILVNAQGDKRVPPADDARAISWFTLPPAMEFYYASAHPGYRSLPPYAEDAQADADAMEMIYPERGAHILVPIQLNGTHTKVVLQAAHRTVGASIHWDLDGNYLGITTGDHRLATDLGDGPHRLTLTDDGGRRLQLTFHAARGSGAP